MKDQQFPSQAVTAVAKLSGEWACLEIPLGPLAGFVAVCLRLAKEGNQTLWAAEQAYRQQNLQLLAYCFQCLQQGTAGQVLPQIFPTYSANVTQELDSLTQIWQSSRAYPLKGTPESLTYTAIASAFGVAFLLINEEKQTYTLPLYAQNATNYQVVPVAAYGGWSLTFAGLNMPEIHLLPLLQEAERAQSLLSLGKLSEAQFQVLKSLVDRIEAANQCLLTQQLDSAAADLWQRANQLKSALVCHICAAHMGSQLTCGHRCCSKCVFPGLEWTPGEQNFSPCCSLPLSLVEIRSLITDAAFNAKLTALRDWGYVICIVCGRPTDQNQSTELSCHHSACLICVVTAIQTNSPLCPLCGVLPDDSHQVIVTNTPLRCSNCNQEKPISGFPKFRCQDHTPCFDCFDSWEVCPCCSRELNPEEHTAISRCFFKCQACNMMKNRKSLFKGGVCGCRICVDCFQEQIRTKRTISTCFLCSARYPESTLDSHFRLFRAALSDLKVPELQPIHHSRLIKEAACSLCDVKDRADKVELPCEHILHCYCLTHKLLDFMLKGEPAACPVCRREIDVGQLQPLDVAIFPADRKCPTAKCVSKTTKIDQNSYKCDLENTVFCLKCHEERKADHPVDACLKASRSKAINLLKKIGYKDCLPEVIECPQCLAPHLKKKNSPVDFHCVVCKAVFCHTCKAPYGPIRAHGDLWHRRDCKSTDAWAGPEAQAQLAAVEKSEGCSKCRDAGKRCEPPT